MSGSDPLRSYILYTLVYDTKYPAPTRAGWGFCFILKVIQVHYLTTAFGTGKAEGVNRLCDRGIILSVGQANRLG